jgi:hypothetical protein
MNLQPQQRAPQSHRAPCAISCANGTFQDTHTFTAVMMAVMYVLQAVMYLSMDPLMLGTRTEQVGAQT